jgi:glycolate oxidase FAD binding subunit
LRGEVGARRAPGEGPVIEQFQQRIRAAAAARAPLRIRGAGSKDFYGNAAAGEILDTRGHKGIVAYEPTELYVTARCGTPLAELERELDAQGQMLAFEPPRFGDGGTVGGMVASGLSGPRRMQAGALRDFVLGVRMVDGRGDDLRFGGRVIKNVAGYDVSRLLAGSLGTLGLIAEVTLKVLPQPAAELSLRFALAEADAIARLNQWAGRPLPVSASAWHDGVLTLRLSGAPAALAAARAALGGEPVADIEAREFWDAVRDHTHGFFRGPLWRIALPSTAPPLALAGDGFIEWNGALRWLRTDAGAAAIRAAATDAGGHATLFRAGDDASAPHAAFAPLPAAFAALHRRVKQAFDPAGVLGPGRLYPEA